MQGKQENTHPVTDTTAVPGLDGRVLVIVTTVGREADAQALAQSLIDARLAACVQVEAGLRSHYRWEGRAMDEPEWRLTVKTRPELAVAVQAHFTAHHPYTLPQCVASVMAASAGYAAWVRDETCAP